jgi:Tol biopolymer transport system component
VAAIAVTVTFVVLARAPGKESPTAEAVRFSISAPENESFGGPSAGGTGLATQQAISPDGRQIVFVAGVQDRFRIWRRPLSSAAPTPIAGTEGGSFPFWSPDSQWIGFFADGKLKKVQVMGGDPVVLCDAAGSRGGTWNRDDVILFTPVTLSDTTGGAGGVHRVSASGGASVEITKVDGASGVTNHRWPHFLPDGRHFIYTAISGTCCPAAIPASVVIESLDRTEPPLTLMHAESSVVYAAGYLFFARDEKSGLLAQSFDPDKRVFKGDAFPVSESVSIEGSRYVSVSASVTGTLVYAQGTLPAPQMTWFDRRGQVIGRMGEPAPYEMLSLSVDEKRVAVAMRSGTPPDLDVWLFNVASGTRVRLTNNPGVDRSPVWSPDGKRVAFISERARAFSLRVMSIDGATDEALVERSDLQQTTSWSANGKYIAFTRGGPGAPGGIDVWAVPLFGSREPFLVANTRFNDSSGVFSPDTKWIAVVSNETGRNEIFVQPFPGPGERHQVSTEGGSYPVWRADGQELFYIGNGGPLDGTLMASHIRPGGDLDFDKPQRLFRLGAPRFSPGQVYAVSRDGERILVTDRGRPQQGVSPPINVALNWPATLQR